MLLFLILFSLLPIITILYFLSRRLREQEEELHKLKIQVIDLSSSFDLSNRVKVVRIQKES